MYAKGFGLLLQPFYPPVISEITESPTDFIQAHRADKTVRAHDVLAIYDHPPATLHLSLSQSTAN